MYILDVYKSINMLKINSRLLIPLIILFMIIGILVLNYFNLLPLSKNFPGLFGWLPHQGSAEVFEGEPRREHPFKEDFFVCPVWGDACKTGFAVMNAQSDQVAGIGFFTLPQETEIIAMVDGEYTVRKSGENVEIVLLDTDKNIEIVYTFVDAYIDANDTPITVLKGDTLFTMESPLIAVTAFERERKYALIVYLNIAGTQNSLPVAIDRETGQVRIL